jgi:hypothetical protein
MSNERRLIDLNHELECGYCKPLLFEVLTLDFI